MCAGTNVEQSAAASLHKRSVGSIGPLAEGWSPSIQQTFQLFIVMRQVYMCSHLHRQGKENEKKNRLKICSATLYIDTKNLLVGYNPTSETAIGCTCYCKC